MKEKWSDGPWEYDTIRDNFSGSDHFEMESFGGSIRAANNAHVARIWSDVSDEPSEYIANAKLIAAAPDMYAALSELHDLVNDIIEGDYQPDSFTLQPARLALKRARGEE